MSIKITRTDEGYVARVTPPESKSGDWTSNAPLTQDELRRNMERLGVHQVDMWDSIRSADRAWFRAHPDEIDESQVINVTRAPNGNGYFALVDHRGGVWSTDHALAREELLAQTDNFRLAPGLLPSRIDDADRAWIQDRESDRAALKSVDVLRTADGYFIRVLGQLRQWPDTALTRDALVDTLIGFSLPHDRVMALLARADDEWEPQSR